MIRIAIIQFPGAPCIKLVIQAIQSIGLIAVVCSHDVDHAVLCSMQGYVLVSGCIEGEEFSRIGFLNKITSIASILQEQSDLGKPILAIGHGASILVEIGLIPGLAHHQVGMAVVKNRCVQGKKITPMGWYHAKIYVRLADEYQRGAFTKRLRNEDIFSMPIAQYAGCFIIPCALLQEIIQQGLPIFQYCDAKGAIIPDFPINPVGSVCNIAGMANKAGNVLVIVPQPEGTEAGKAIFLSMKEYITVYQHETVIPLYYYPRCPTLHPYPYRDDSGIVGATNTMEPVLNHVAFGVLDHPLTSIHRVQRNLAGKGQEAQLRCVQERGTEQKRGLKHQARREVIEYIWPISQKDQEIQMLNENFNQFIDPMSEVKMRRYIHWEILTDFDQYTAQDLQLKHFLKKHSEEAQLIEDTMQIQRWYSNSPERWYLVQEKLDAVSMLLYHQWIAQGWRGVESIRRGILWCFAGDQVGQITDYLFRTHLLYNPYSQNCYTYHFSQNEVS